MSNPNQTLPFAGTSRSTASAFQAFNKTTQSQRVEQLGLLATGIAHDFNNLLTSIMGHTSLALLHLDPDNTARSHIEQTLKTAEYAAALTTQLLTYVHAGQPETELMNFNHLVQTTIDMLVPILFKDITLQLNLSPDLPPIEAAPVQIQQVIMNLILNATQAIDKPDGIITLATGQMSSSQGHEIYVHQGAVLLPGEYLYFSVADNGKGIDTAALPHIFDPFFSTKRGGQGLGLSTINGIIERHNGGVAVESQLHEGTKFTVYLPLRWGSKNRLPIH